MWYDIKAEYLISASRLKRLHIRSRFQVLNPAYSEFTFTLASSQQTLRVNMRSQ